MSLPKDVDSALYTEIRPWGSFTVLQDESHFKAKRLVVKPGQRLSLQLHHQREEHWLVVKGVPDITVADKTWQAKVGEYIHIPKGVKHRLGNQSDETAEIVEIQLGAYFGEDDIVRFEDDYQRT
ncbi:MAG: phosphomannose isomerase type II C-terminal cupin domain [Vampirovibrio sp.]|nr:phosphomannose isomerase type II C-terminal cupin domain [Vampirovibrio sp.]